MHLKILIILGVFLVLNLNAQNKSLTEKLEDDYLTKNLTVKKQLEILGILAQESPDPKRGLLYSDKLIQLAKKEGDLDLILQGLTQRGNALAQLGELSLALEVYLEAVDLAESTNNVKSLGVNYIAIAGVYSIMDNKTNTISFYRKALNILESTDFKIQYASALENLGDEYNLSYSQPDSALYYFEQSGKIFTEENYALGKAYNLGNKGLAYAQLGYSERAEGNLKSAIELLNDLGDYAAISVYLIYYSDMYNARGELKAAKEFAETSLSLATKYGLKDQISDANLKLSELAEVGGDIDEALGFYKMHTIYKDSVKNISVSQELANQRREFELGNKQKELDLLSVKEQSQRTRFIGIAVALFLISLLAFGLYRRTIFISRTKKIIESERNRSDKLLLNILPEEIAAELKSSGKVKAQKFDSVSVLFTDFKGFTNYAENLSPELLVESVGFYFSEFDKIIDKYGLEKIKTIGDSYMCASGLPIYTEDHTLSIVKAGIDMVNFVNSVKHDATKKYAYLDIRIGIHSGSVVAGVVGTKKFAYDIWGDTVNVASRMESMSEVGKINISQSTFELIENHFSCHYRGEFKVRNHGGLKMYFIENGIST